MTTLLKNGNVINVFTGEIEKTNVLIEDQKIIGVGSYTQADVVEDVSGKYICPGFIDGHIHIESTMLLPGELAKVCVPHGTSAIVADPHEIANVCGIEGISYMLEMSKHLPMRFYYLLPSCVPATDFDESGAILEADALEPFYANDWVLGLAEMMNYPGVVHTDPRVVAKLKQTHRHGKIIGGHAPLLSSAALDKYISMGIQDDHECSSIEEALEKLRKGMWIMIRQGTSARNLEKLLPLFDPPYNHRCILVTDDKHPYDLLENGHIDSIIRESVKLGKNPVIGIQMATIQAAQRFGLRHMGAVAPGYSADLVIMDDLSTVDVCDVYHNGIRVCHNKALVADFHPKSDAALSGSVTQTVHMNPLTPADFHITPQDKPCRVIQAIPGELLTNEDIRTLDFSKDNGVDVRQDIIKLAVCERHQMTGHIGLGFIEGLGIKKGAIASTVSHDAHNLIITGTNEQDMALAGNTLLSMGGGLCVVCDGKVLSAMSLPIAGLMSDREAREVSEENRLVRDAVRQLGVAEGIEPFMNTAFVSLAVIPNLKMTTHGLLDVNRQLLVSLFV